MRDQAVGGRYQEKYQLVKGIISGVISVSEKNILIENEKKLTIYLFKNNKAIYSNRNVKSLSHLFNNNDKV